MEKMTKKQIIELVVATLKGDADIQRLTDGNVFAFFSKQPVSGPFIALDSYATTFDQCKDGRYADGFSFAVACVADSLTTVDAMEERVTALLDGLTADTLPDSLRLTSVVTSGDGNDFVCKINIETDL